MPCEFRDLAHLGPLGFHNEGGGARAENLPRASRDVNPALDRTDGIRFKYMTRVKQNGGSKNYAILCTIIFTIIFTINDRNYHINSSLKRLWHFFVGF